MWYILANSIDLVATSLTVDTGSSPLIRGQKIGFSADITINVYGTTVLEESIWPHADLKFVLSPDKKLNDETYWVNYRSFGCLKQKLSAAYSDPSTVVQLEDKGKALFCVLNC